MRYSNQGKVFSIPSEMGTISDGKSLPPLTKKTLGINRRSVRDGDVCQSLEVDRFIKNKLNESADITSLDLKKVNVGTRF